MTRPPRTDPVAIISSGGPAVTAVIHDAARRAVDVHCSRCGRFLTIGYSRSATADDIGRARRDATEAAVKHAAGDLS